MLYAQKLQKCVKLFCIIEKSGTRHGTRRLWLIAIKSRQSAIAISKYRKATSIIMCSAFRFFTLERITSRCYNGQALRRLTFRGFVFIILYIPFEPCAPCLLYGRLAPFRALAVIRRLVGGGSAALPCRSNVGAPCSVVRSYNTTFWRFIVFKKEK